MEGQGSIDGIKRNPEKKMNRREFLKSAGKAGVAVGAGVVAPKVYEIVQEKKKEREVARKLDAIKGEAKEWEEAHEESEAHPEEVEPNKEGDEHVLPPIEQLVADGEISDMEGGLEMLYEKDLKYYTENPSGIRELHTIAENASKYDLDRLTRPFVAKGFTKDLALKIICQESKFKNQTSPSGARGILQIMLHIAERYKYTEKDLSNPYKSAECAVKILEDERKTIGTDERLLMSRYNAGHNLFGFPKHADTDEITYENFISYMKESINSKFKKIESDVGFEYKVKSHSETLKSVANKYGISERLLSQRNGMRMGQTININDQLFIPIENPNASARLLFAGQRETLRYVPQALAKYDALKKVRPTKQIELAMS